MLASVGLKTRPEYDTGCNGNSDGHENLF
ncbi:unnamed protein product, partial [Didymodactylos carnosus]